MEIFETENFIIVFILIYCHFDQFNLFSEWK